ncbi:FMN-dependent NADH-azoreductase [Roseomonas sp. BN140053]|uniref:FMN-dependent NADH-azoreductase n=1 Tax=Roseomonas sp. BN140053 TaxID=3391898 RepID=UPI0039E85732
MKLLHVDSSITGGRSVTRELTALIVRRLAGEGAAAVTYRDLVAEELPHFTAATAPTAHPMSKAAPVLDAAQQARRTNSDAILQEFLDADVVVIGVPMYNFSIPSELKAWFDRLAVPGVTFRYGAAGPEGLAGNKRVILAIARGGFYGADTARFSAEHAESFLRAGFGFLGVRDIEVVLAEGLNIDEHTKGRAIASARDAIGQLAA